MKGKVKVMQFHQERLNDNRKHKSLSMQSEEEKIKEFEQKAAQYEQMETDLLSRLKNTQIVEKQAFTELEKIMMDSAMPKSHRANMKKFKI